MENIKKPAPIYHFQFADGYNVSLPTAPTPIQADDLPAWTALDFHQCANCPLSPANTPHCPMAVRFVQLMSIVDKRQSYDPVTVNVEMQERNVTKVTTVQRAVGSLMGLLSATSDCPHVNFLKPMSHFHLPFSTEEESIYRVASMFLLGQYFLRQQNKTADWNLEILKVHYQELQIVNAAMAGRLRAISPSDGALNALVLLDLLAKALPYSIDEALDELRPIFEKS